MSKERMYFIAYEVCNYMRKREMQNQYTDYEFCMYVSELAQAIEYAVVNQDGKFLEQYYEVLNDELENLCGVEDYVYDVENWIKEVKELIKLLDEWKEV